MYKIITPDKETVYDKKVPQGEDAYARSILLLGSPKAYIGNTKEHGFWQPFVAKKFIYQELKERVDKSMLPELDFYMIDDYNIGNMSWLVEKANRADYVIMYIDGDKHQQKTIDLMLYSLYIESKRFFVCYTEDSPERKLLDEYALNVCAREACEPQYQEYSNVKDAASAMLDKLIQSIIGC